MSCAHPTHTHITLTQEGIHALVYSTQPVALFSVIVYVHLVLSTSERIHIRVTVLFAYSIRLAGWLADWLTTTTLPWNILSVRLCREISFDVIPTRA